MSGDTAAVLMLSSFAFTSGSTTAAAKAADSLSMIGFGVPLGAYRPNQMLISKPFTPISESAGKSGNPGSRFVQGAGGLIAHDVNLPAHQVVNGWGCAFVGHQRELDI